MVHHRWCRLVRVFLAREIQQHDLPRWSYRNCFLHHHRWEHCSHWMDHQVPWLCSILTRKMRQSREEDIIAQCWQSIRDSKTLIPVAPCEAQFGWLVVYSSCLFEHHFLSSIDNLGNEPIERHFTKRSPEDFLVPMAFSSNENPDHWE